MEKMNGVHVTIGKFRLADNLKTMQYVVPGKGVTTLGWTKVDFGFEDTEGNWLC
jgi:glycerol 2-dehydrogenase (NADP+)